MRIIILCNSDQLALPVIMHLQRQGTLVAIAIPKRSNKILFPLLLSVGIPATAIHLIHKENLELQLQNLILEEKAAAAFTLTFPWKIPATILALPTFGFINFHFGKLPNYKGGDPIFWQIKNRQQYGAISIHQMTDTLDEGTLFIRQEISIIPGETYGLHCQRLGTLAIELANKLITQLQNNTLFAIDISTEQDAMYDSPTEDELTIKWEIQTADEIEYLVNATNPKYGGAITSIKENSLRLLEVSPADVNTTEQFVPGTIVYADVVYGLIVACINGEFLKINIASTQHGFVSGIKLFQLGLSLGEKFV